MEPIWLKNYPQDVSYTIDPSQYTSLTDLFTKSCQKFKDNIAFSNFGTNLSYQALDYYSLTFAKYLQSLGLPPSARVAIMLPNILQYPVVLFAILRAGYVIVNVNPLYTAEELAHQINDAECDTIIVMSNFAKTVETALPKTMLKNIIITEMGDLFPWFKKSISYFIVHYVKRMIKKYNIPNATSWDQAIKIGKNYLNWLAPVQKPQDLALLQYTGGTTGRAKGAMLSHFNIIANILQAEMWIKPINLNCNDCVITALPLYHIFSLTANCFIFIKSGAHNVLITNPRDMKQFISQINKLKFTIITGVNTLYNGLLNHPLFNSINFSELKLALSGGMALQKHVADLWFKKTGHPIIEAYGLTETSPAVAINPLNIDTLNHNRFNGSIGLPLPSTEVSIRDSNEQELDIKTPGELCVKGPQVMQGYWRQTEETKHVFTHDQFLKTGDIAVINEQGFITIVDRKKDMIIISGFNVYPKEIEEVIAMHPGVLEVGVIGVSLPSDLYPNEYNEVVKACVVKKDPDLTEDEIIKYCKQHLTNYKIPKIIKFCEALPKSNVGKILRRELHNI